MSAEPLTLARRNDRPERAGRVPPHNLQAEESLLGAMLLSKDAIVASTEVGLSADDFYKPAHGHVYAAVSSLYSAGEPADPVTVAEELQRAGLLEAIGGPALLVSLQARTPATSNAGRYARIVEEHALLRRLIGVANEIAEIGYGLPEDVPAALDRAESMVFEVAERRVTDSMASLRELLDQSLTRLEMLYERGEAVTGLATGYLGLDELLSGLQPSTLVVVGARPATGKCLPGDTLLVDPTTGERRRLDEIHRRGRAGEELEVLSLDAEHRLRLRRPSDFLDNGVQPVFRVRTRLGRTLRCTATHPLLSRSGWRPLSQLRVGQRIAVPRSLPIFGVEGRPDAEVAAIAESTGDSRRVDADAGVPDAAFRLPRAQLALFLNRLLATDASVGWSDRLRRVGVVCYSSTSVRLVADVAHLLLRFGINARVSCHPGVAASTPIFELELRSVEEIRDFAAEIGIGGREAALGEVVASLASRGRSAPVPSASSAAPTGARAPAAVLERGRQLSDPVVLWDEVVSIEADGEERVYDLTVPDDHNFVADDVFVHNSAFALGVAAHAALEANRPVLMFSLEMSHMEMTQRLLSAEARVDSQKLRNGRLADSDWTKISHAIGRLAEARLYIDDNPQTTVMEIRAKARRLRAQLGDLGLVVVDYLQLMTGRSNAENRQVEVSEISRGLKILARELEVPVVALSQLSRGLEQRADKRPMLSDLRESGSIEQDSDVVMFLYRDELYNSDSPDRGTAEVIVAKHRSGPTGVVRLAFLEHYTRFANMAKGA